MMSPKRWTLLLIFYISYLMFGASIYYHIEHNLETERRAENLQQRNEIHEYLVDQLSDKNETTQTEILEKITGYCGKPVTNYKNDEFEVPYTWTFYHSFFFAFTVCSTVGYGNISPTTTLGRMVMIVYSLIGIPVNGILFAGLGEYFGRTFSSIYRRYKKYKMSNDVHYVPPQLGLVTTVLIALIPGITVFLLIPSWVFSYFEDWPYSLSFYYAYVTTTTIGFGDYVPTFQPTQPREFGGWFIVYEIFIIVWFIFSLGYLLMILTFITRGLKSKKLKRLEQQLSSNIKATQNRIWSGVAKDVGYLRRILNELYILKVKPVYAEPVQVIHRSISCPDLSLYRTEPAPIPRRERAFSLCADAMEDRADGTPLYHASSDTELDKFDKQKSFETAEAYRQTTDLLAKVVSALATVKPTDHEEHGTIGSVGMFGGYHGFSDSQILASEWSFSTAHDPPKPRGRACSDFNIDPKWKVRRPIGSDNEWTWSGDNQRIQKVINIRHKEKDRPSFGQATSDYIVNMNEGSEENIRKSRVKKFSMPDGLKKLFPFRKRVSSENLESGIPGKSANQRKFSIISVPEIQLQRSPPMDYYSSVSNSVMPPYMQNGRANLGFTSDVSISSRLSNSSAAKDGYVSTVNGAIPRTILDPGQTSLNLTSPYLRKSVAGARKRRESLFTPNPALSGRRGSMFPATTGNAAAALSQRRGSLFNTERRGSSASVAAFGDVIGGANAGLQSRRGSIFRGGISDMPNAEVLENTTLADLIRALEVVHTQAVMDEQAQASINANANSGFSGIFRSDKKKRKSGNTGIDPTAMPPILSLFDRSDSRIMTAAATNRLYARRSTIVGTLPNNSFNNVPTGRSSNAMLIKRKPSLAQIVEPPASHSKRESNASSASSVAPNPTTISQQTSVVNKFRRRFSVRPTTLQIPPGQAPPPGVSITSAMQEQQQRQQQSASDQMGTTPANVSQTALQRRLSLRPSPLAREFTLNSSGIASNSSGSNEASPPISPTTTTSSTARLLPNIAPRPSSTTSSTHSPLSRIVQISQAQRKISMPDGFATRKNEK